MYRPYTNDYPTALAIASQAVGASLVAICVRHPLKSRLATPLFVTAAVGTALIPSLVPRVIDLGSVPLPYVLQGLMLLATAAMFLQRRLSIGVTAVLGQMALVALALFMRSFDDELVQAHLAWLGALLGCHLLTTAAPRRDYEPARRSFWLQEALLFCGTVLVSHIITSVVFGRLIYNGDEVAYSFQAHVYGQLKAYAPVQPCASMFENYWVFNQDGRLFSQYTPGWPLFMAPFARIGLIDWACPTAAGLLAVGMSRLSRRLAGGLAPTTRRSERIEAVAGVLGPVLALLGPSMLLNAAARFSHIMVLLCFVWAIEAACVLGAGRERAGRVWLYGFVLGSVTALGLATRPADGGFVAVGVGSYFLWATLRRQIGLRAWVATGAGFALFIGLTLVLLRLQLGKWFQTGYALAPSTHAEAVLKLSLPQADQWKYGIPLAWGSYMFWPVAPALGLAGLIRTAAGQERRIVLMSTVGPLIALGFYALVEFGRYTDDGLGPRYQLVLVVPMAIGGAAVLAPLVESLRVGLDSPFAWTRRIVAASLFAAAVVYGVAAIAPLVYPVAKKDVFAATAPLRGARDSALKNAIVAIIPGHATAHETNLAQNTPFEKSPDVLFLIRRSNADEQCAREHFPGRTWYRAGMDDHLTPF